MAATSQDPSDLSPPLPCHQSLGRAERGLCRGVGDDDLRMAAGAVAACGNLLRLQGPGQIERVPEEYTGQWLAKIGIGLGVGLGIVLGAWLLFFRSEVPHGYQVLDWSDLEPDPNNKTEPIPATALALSDKKTKVYVRGYIIPGRRQVQLTQFSICRTSDQCRFANTMGYRPTDLVYMELTGDRTIDYTAHQIGLGGIFRVDPQFSNGTPYHIQVHYIYQ